MMPIESVRPIAHRPQLPYFSNATMTTTGGMIMNTCCSDTVGRVYRVVLALMLSTAMHAMNAQVRSCDFGGVTIGSHKDTTIIVLNNASIALTVNSISMKNNPSDFTILSGTAPFTIPVGGTYTFSLRFTPSMPGLRTDSIIIAGLFPGPVYIDLRGTGVLVPVELSSFNAKLFRNEVVLDWRTESEENNSGFEIERALMHAGNGLEFASIAFVPCAGNSRSMHVYQYVDRVPDNMKATGISYRLRQVDNDGGASYSDIVSVDMNQVVGPESMRISTWPNPSRGIVNIQGCSGIEERLTLRVYDEVGRCIYDNCAMVSDAGGRFNMQLNTGTSAFRSGVYLIAVEGASGSFVVPVFVLK